LHIALLTSFRTPSKSTFRGSGKVDRHILAHFCVLYAQEPKKDLHLTSIEEKTIRQLQQCINSSLQNGIYPLFHTHQPLLAPSDKFPKLSTPSHISPHFRTPTPTQPNITPPRSIEEATTTDTKKHKGEIASNLMVWYL